MRQPCGRPTAPAGALLLVSQSGMLADHLTGNLTDSPPAMASSSSSSSESISSSSPSSSSSGVTGRVLMWCLSDPDVDAWSQYLRSASRPPSKPQSVPPRIEAGARTPRRRSRCGEPNIHPAVVDTGEAGSLRGRSITHSSRHGEVTRVGHIVRELVIVDARLGLVGRREERVLKSAAAPLTNQGRGGSA